MLAPESAEEQLGRIGAAAPAHRGEDQSREIGVVEDLHGPVPSRSRVVHGAILRWDPYRTPPARFEAGPSPGEERTVAVRHMQERPVERTRGGRPTGMLDVEHTGDRLGLLRQVTTGDRRSPSRAIPASCR